MNDICKGCGKELPPSSSKRGRCPHCGETARILRVQARAVGTSSARAKVTVIRPDPVKAEARVAPVAIVIEELPVQKKPSLKTRRNSAYYVLIDDIRREPDGSLISDYLVERLVALCNVMEREARDGRYDE